jgi:hypothetical protein
MYYEVQHPGPAEYSGDKTYSKNVGPSYVSSGTHSSETNARFSAVRDRDHGSRDEINDADFGKVVKAAVDDRVHENSRSAANIEGIVGLMRSL